MKYKTLLLGGGANTPQNKSTDNKDIKVSDSEINNYEQKTWSEAWVIHNNSIAAPVKTKKEFVKQRVIRMKKQTMKKSKEEKFSQLTGIQKLQASKSGLGKAFTQGVQQGARAFDSFSRSVEKMGDYASLRGPRTRAILDRVRSRTSGLSRRDRYRDREERALSSKAFKTRQEEARAKALARKLALSKQVIDPVTGKQIVISKIGDSCKLDKDCDNELAFCKINEDEILGDLNKNGKCAPKPCDMYKTDKKCGLRHICLPVDSEQKFIPDKKFSAKTKVQDLQVTKKLADYKDFKEIYPKISALKHEIRNMYSGITVMSGGAPTPQPDDIKGLLGKLDALKKNSNEIYEKKGTVQEKKDKLHDIYGEYSRNLELKPEFIKNYEKFRNKYLETENELFNPKKIIESYNLMKTDILMKPDNLMKTSKKKKKKKNIKISQEYIFLIKENLMKETNITIIVKDEPGAKLINGGRSHIF